VPPYSFWYIFATNGEDGFLLDLVSRPEESVARLAVYHQGSPPRIVRHGFPPGSLSGVPGELKAALNGVELDAAGCRSALENMSIDARFGLNGRSMRFVPAWVSWWFDNVPDFRSHYGTLERANCEGATYAKAPMVCSTYSLGDLASARWVLISAPRFDSGDLAIEISAARLLGRWMPTAWMFFGGREYKLNSGLDSLFRVRIGSAGVMEDGQLVFTASLRAPGMRVDVEARGAVEQFARLESERQTEIHTTLFGTCRASFKSGPPAGRTFTAERTCLLELKN
jgi:hypothetical protein